MCKQKNIVEVQGDNVHFLLLSTKKSHFTQKFDSVLLALTQFKVAYSVSGHF